MKQTLRIFRKDVTHLWPHITIVLLLVAAFAVSSVQSSEPENFPEMQLRFVVGLLAVLVPPAYAWLIVTLVHQEALPGDRQFWLTRPYNWKSLLAAKATFVVLFVCLTMVAKDCFIVSAQGFPIIANLPGLLLRQLAWSAWVVLPALAAAAVTRNLQETSMVGGTVALVYGIQGTLARKPSWPGIEWVPDYFAMLVLLALPAAILLWQYGRRETTKARIAAACCALLVLVGIPLLPGNLAFAVQILARKPKVDLLQIQLTTDLARPPSNVPTPVNTQDPVAIGLPLQLSGVPPGMTLMPDAASVTIVSGQHEIWSTGWQQTWYGGQPGKYQVQVFHIENRIYRSVENQPVTVKLSLGLTLLEDDQPIYVPAHQRVFSIDGSRCEDTSPRSYPPSIWCFSALRAQPRTMVRLDAPGAAGTNSQMGTSSYAPYQAILDLSPLAVTPLPVVPPRSSNVDWSAIWKRPDTRIVLTSQHPVAHFRRELEFPGVRLAAYVLPPLQTGLQAVPGPH